MYELRLMHSEKIFLLSLIAVQMEVLLPKASESATHPLV